MADPQPESLIVVEYFTSPIVICGHIWCSIDHVNYYVWLKQLADNGEFDDGKFAINPKNIEQTDWSAHGVLPGKEKDMEHVKVVVNKGLDLIRAYLIRFCEEAAARSDEDPHIAGLSQSITLPNSWDHFSTALLDARTITAHDRYMRWYKCSFRGKKRSYTDTPSSNPTSGLSSPGNKRFAGGQ
ncbi:hypothetical protein JVT61DRAFT_14587 [Boletus reticuloceps]|uniref:Uncharacterized protein n=1 Tax=Boletus reticuloceps TaxID=495285 RepID=A0A8I3AAB3_9AGAM|nr:hypothetical protein JVT61DRAFT_14587 [Boletus reticuloceps]